MRHYPDICVKLLKNMKKNISLCSVAGLRVDILARDSPNTKEQCYIFDRDFR
jgi:hypothetical protein